MGMIFASSMTRQLPEMELSPQVPHRPAQLLSGGIRLTRSPLHPACRQARGYKMTAHLLAQGCRRIALIQENPGWRPTTCGWRVSPGADQS